MRNDMPILLLGAGFSRNWGGWLASDFVGELCGRLVDRPHLNEMLRVSNNFEAVLGARRVTVAREPDNVQAAVDVTHLESAILDTFRDMNSSLADQVNINFSQEAKCSTRRFLSRFDAIFTLNQDLLFELHYDGMYLESDGRWRGGHYFPGVIPTYDWQSVRFNKDRIDLTLQVADAPSSTGHDLQPIYKLHGSVNWRSSDGNNVLVIGTGKEEAISGSALLRRYQEIFREYLFHPTTRLMVIGYGFADRHINDLLCEASRNNNLQMYLIGPSGTDAFSADTGPQEDGRNRLLKILLAGKCTRYMNEIFADSDNPAFKSVERFLAPAKIER